MHGMSTDVNWINDNFGPRKYPNEWNQFKKILDRYPNVVAIFAGHIHKWIGQMECVWDETSKSMRYTNDEERDWKITTPSGRKIDVFFGGGAEWNHYLKVEFHADKIKVTPIYSVYGYANHANGKIWEVRSTPLKPNWYEVNFDGPKKTINDFCATKGWTKANYFRTVGDVNGDGKIDLIGFKDDGTYVSLSNGSSFDAKKKWINNFGVKQGWTTTNHVRAIADVNGDGKDDIVGFTSDGTLVSLSTGNSFQAPILWIPDFGSKQGWKVNQHVRTLGDINNDGKADIVAINNNGVVYSLAKKTGNGFEKANFTKNGIFSNANGWKVNQHVRTLGDITGDGYVDIVGFGSKVSVSFGLNPLIMGILFTNPNTLNNKFGNSSSFGNYIGKRHPRMLADVNGDGLDDLVGFEEKGVYVALADGAGYFTPKTLALSSLTIGNGAWLVSDHPRHMGDVDGDGREDIIGFGGDSVFVAFSKTGQ